MEGIPYSLSKSLQNSAHEKASLWRYPRLSTCNSRSVHESVLKYAPCRSQLPTHALHPGAPQEPQAPRRSPHRFPQALQGQTHNQNAHRSSSHRHPGKTWPPRTAPDPQNNPHQDLRCPKTPHQLPYTVPPKPSTGPPDRAFPTYISKSQAESNLWCTPNQLPHRQGSHHLPAGRLTVSQKLALRPLNNPNQSSRRFDTRGNVSAFSRITPPVLGGTALQLEKQALFFPRYSPTAHIPT